MKKILLGIIGGAALGAVLIGFIIFIGSFQSVGSAGQHKDPTQSGSTSSVPSEDEFPSGSEEPSETESAGATDSELPTEPEWPTDLPTEPAPTTEPEQPTDEPIEPEPSEPAEPDKPREIPYYIKVNRAANCVTIYTKDENGNYTVPYKSMICSVGTYYWDTKTETVKGNTPLGTYKMPGQRYKWRLLFGPDGLDVYGHYTTRIVGHILFHSVPYTVKGTTPGTVKTLWEGQYNRLGSPASKGCIRLSVADSKWIYDNCGEGTIVEIYDDAANPGPLGRPEAIKIPDESPFAGWDPTDPDKNNPWHTGEVVLSGVTNVADIERGTLIDWNKYFVGKSTVDISDDVKATDVDGLGLTISLNSLLDISKIGKYTMTYTATGVTGKTDSETITVTVVDTIKPMLEIDPQYLLDAVIEVDDGDSKEDILAKIHQILAASDRILPEGTGINYVKEALDDSRITVDISALEKAMKSKTPGSYQYIAYVTDEAGNKSEVLTLNATYERSDVEDPSITVKGNIQTTVDLSDIADEAERREAMIQAAKDALVLGKNYSVSDDLSATENIQCKITGKYEGDTATGNHNVIITITATDEVGHTTSVDVTVAVTVTDNTGSESETETGTEVTEQ